MWIQVVHFVPKKSKQCKWSVVTNVEIRRVWHLDLVTYWCESWIIYDLGWPVERWVKGGFVFESWLCYKGHFDGNNTGSIIQSSFVWLLCFVLLSIIYFAVRPYTLHRHDDSHSPHHFHCCVYVPSLVNMSGLYRRRNPDMCQRPLKTTLCALATISFVHVPACNCLIRSIFQFTHG